MLIVVSDVAGIILISWQYSNGFFDTLSHTQSAINGLDQTYQYASIIGTFFERIVNAIFVVIFVEVGNGFRYAQLKKPPAYKNTLRIAALVGALAIFTLSVAYFAFPLAALVKYYQSQTAQNSNAIAEAYDTGRSLRAAGDVINFVISIAQVLFAAVVARQHAGLPARKVSYCSSVMKPMLTGVVYHSVPRCDDPRCHSLGRIDCPPWRVDSAQNRSP